MNQNLYLVLILVVIIAYRLLTSYFGIAHKVKISPQDAKNLLENEKDSILLDVRTKGEHLNQRIPKSTLIPVNVLVNESAKKLPDKNAKIIVYCAQGSRSAKAVKILNKLGYTNIYNLGGLANWPYKIISGK